MNRRSELRFQIYTNAKVAPFEQPHHEIEVQMVDVSSSGIRFITDVEFTEAQIVTIETEQHLILADVRNCKARGIRFGVGAERVHSVAKFALPRTTSTAERNQALAADYRRRLQQELEKPAVPGRARANGAPTRFAPGAEQPKMDPKAAAALPDSATPAPVGVAAGPVRPAARWPRASAWLSILGLFIVLTLLPSLAGNRAPEAGEPTAADSSPAPVLIVDSAVPPAADSHAEESSVAAGVRGSSWVTECAGGRKVELANRAVVQAGNAARVRLQPDGKTRGPLGRDDEVGGVELAPGSSRILADGGTGGCSPAQ